MGAAMEVAVAPSPEGNIDSSSITSMNWLGWYLIRPNLSFVVTLQSYAPKVHR